MFRIATKAHKRHCSVRLLNTSTIKEGWEAVIGIEVHAQINTKTKLFSGTPFFFCSILYLLMCF